MFYLFKNSSSFLYSTSTIILFLFLHIFILCGNHMFFFHLKDSFTSSFYLHISHYNNSIQLCGTLDNYFYSLPSSFHILFPYNKCPSMLLGHAFSSCKFFYFYIKDTPLNLENYMFHIHTSHLEPMLSLIFIINNQFNGLTVMFIPLQHVNMSRLIFAI